MKDLKALKIGIIFGGWSAERVISVQSGRAVFNCLLDIGF